MPSMQNDAGFAAKRIYPSEQGLHIEHYDNAQAQAAYADAKRVGADVELNGLVLTWKFSNPRLTKFSTELTDEYDN